MKLPKLSLAEWFMAVLTLGYTGAFYHSISVYLFNPVYSTDDARQQSHPLWQAIYPDAFEGDPITESMMGYLSPIHWWISKFITSFTYSPVITGHIVGILQLLLSLAFLYKLVFHYAGRIPALFSLCWFLHSRNLPQRMTGGLPRGWGACVILSFLYFAAKEKQPLVLLVLLLGILTNPPAAFLCGACYGLLLIVQSIKGDDRDVARKRLLRYILVCPIFVVVAFFTLERPEKFGHMASLDEAEDNPAFSRNGGRFPFIPLKSPVDEIGSVGLQAFINKWHEPPIGRDALLGTLSILLACVYVVSIRKKRQLLPQELTVFLFSIISVYFLSRLLAFRLYVPDRHLQFPLNVFWIAAFSILIWRLSGESAKRALSWFFAFGIFLVLLGGTGLEGNCNFNIKMDGHPRLYAWVRLNTSRQAIFAGHPKDLDSFSLQTVRPVYISEETAHPFYNGYWALCKKRLETTFRMFYASSKEEFLKALGDEKVDYFIFSKERFTSEALATASSFVPFDRLVKRLVKARLGDFFFESLNWGVHQQSIVYEDEEYTVVNVSALRGGIEER